MKNFFYKILKIYSFLVLTFTGGCSFNDSNSHYFEQVSDEFFDYSASLSSNVYCDLSIYLPNSKVNLDYLIGDFTYEIRLCFTEPVYFNNLKISNNQKINLLAKNNYQNEKCFIEYDFFIDIPPNIDFLSISVEYLNYSILKDYQVYCNELQISIFGFKQQYKYNPKGIAYVNNFWNYKTLHDEYNLNFLSLNDEFFEKYGLLLLWQGIPSSPPSSVSFTNCILYENTLYAEIKMSSSDRDFTNDYASIYIFAIRVPLEVAENYKKIFYVEVIKDD